MVVKGWFDEDQIGYYDDDDSEIGSHKDCAVVYCGDMYLALDLGYHLIPYKYLKVVTTDDLWNRKQKIEFEIGGRLLSVPKELRPSFEHRYKLLLELAYIETILTEWFFIARFNVKGKAKAKIFISHSTKDKQFAKWLAIDLANAGHLPWLDEWDIRAGESIPTQIGLGVEECQFLLFLLSKNSVASQWVEREWQAKYWKEVQENKVMVIPVLLEECDIPLLLQTKKYADFRFDYGNGLETILNALLPNAKRRKNRSLSIQKSKKSDE